MVATSFIHDGSSWRKAKDIYLHDGSLWRQAKQIYMHDGSAWRLVFIKDGWVPVGNLTYATCLASFNDSLYCGTGNGLYQWTGASWIQVYITPLITQMFATTRALYVLANGVLLKFNTENTLIQTIPGYNNFNIITFSIASPNIKASCGGLFCSFDGTAWTYLSNYSYTFDRQGQVINGRIYFTNTGAPTTRSIPSPDDGSMYVHSSAWDHPAGQAFCWSNYGLTCCDMYNNRGVWYLSGTTWNRIGTGMNYCSSIVYDGSRIIAVDSSSGINYWTGSIWVPIAINNPSQASFLLIHAGSLYACGFTGVYVLASGS